MARRADFASDPPPCPAPETILYAVVSFVRRGARMAVEDIHYLDTYEQAEAVARFIASRRPGVLVLSVVPEPDGGEPQIAVLERIGAGLASATATLH